MVTRSRIYVWFSKTVFIKRIQSDNVTQFTFLKTLIRVFSYVIFFVHGSLSNTQSNAREQGKLTCRKLYLVRKMLPFSSLIVQTGRHGGRSRLT